MNLTGSVSVPFQSVFQFRSQPLCDTSVKPTENDSPTASAALIQQVSDPAGIWSGRHLVRISESSDLRLGGTADSLPNQSSGTV